MLKTILKVDWWHPGKRDAGGVGTPKKGYTACNDAAVEEDQNARSFGRTKNGQNVKTGSCNMAKFSKLSFWSSNGNEVTGKLCGISSVLASAKRLNVFAKRKLYSRLKFYPSESSRPSPEITSVSAAGSSSKTTRSASSTVESEVMDKTKITTENRSSEAETSLSNVGRNTIAVSHAAPTSGVSISDSVPDGNSGANSVPTRRLRDESNRRASSGQNGTNNSAPGTPQIHSQGQFPENVLGSCSVPSSNGHNPSSSVPSTARQSGFSQHSGALPSGPSTNRQSGFSQHSGALPSGPSTNRQFGFSQHSGALPSGPSTNRQSVFSQHSGALPSGPSTDRQSGFSQPQYPNGTFIFHSEPEIMHSLSNDPVAIRSFIERARRSTNLSYNDMRMYEIAQLAAILEGSEEYQDLTPEQILDGYAATSPDVDNMSYEELLALEETMGTVNTGISKESMHECLKRSHYFKASSEAEITELGDNRDDIKCSICQEEYNAGDLLGNLVKCQHGYHHKCIDQWLQMKNWCPICRVTVAPSQQS